MHPENVGILKYENEKDKFLSAVQGLSTISTVVVIAICYVFYSWFYKITELNKILLLVMSIQLLFSTPMLYWSAKERFEYKYVKVVCATMFSSMATVAVSLLLIYYMKDKSYSLIIGAAIIQIVIGVGFYIYNLGKGKKFFDKEIWKYGVSFGIPLIPHYLAYSILNTSDRAMINNMCSTSDAGIYSLACQISIAVNLVASAIDSSMNPWVYQNLKEKNYKKISKVTNYIMCFFSIVVIGCTLVAPEILLVVAPKEYQAAKWAMPPVIAGCFFLYLAGCFMRIEFYHEKKRNITLASIVAAILNIVLNLIFIPKFGFLAAAYTTLLSYIIFALIHFRAMYSICKENNYVSIPFDVKGIFGISIITLVGGEILILLYEYPIWRYGIILLIFAIAVVSKEKLKRIFHMIKGDEK